MPNRLAQETSPYLLQHQNNPVDWYPWGQEALGRARREDRPIFLSIGYSACHWCHVMAHESFEDETTAAFLNKHFVNIKVDREERPDVDSIYMNAVQAISGTGGWPLSVFLLPDGRPFYGGTYFPDEARYGTPSFAEVLQRVVTVFAENRDNLEADASTLTRAISRAISLETSTTEFDTSEIFDIAFQRIASSFDPENGGFGSQPKFPPSMTIEWLFRMNARNDWREAAHIATHTLDRMMYGGIHDQIGGGFHRYSTDKMWLIPHFEKMLYDNALLARAYLYGFQSTGDMRYREVVETTLGYIQREITAPDGCFYSSQDADSEGHEGSYFLWSEQELNQALGGMVNVDAVFDYWGVTKGANFDSKNILWVPEPPEAIAFRHHIGRDQLENEVAKSRDLLMDIREKRIAPSTDTKILTAWNALMITSLAQAGRALENDSYIKMAARAARFIIDKMCVDGRLRRSYKDGQAKFNAYLEDYAFLIESLIELYQSDFNVEWFQHAVNFATRMIELYWTDDAGFYDTTSDHESLILRPQDPTDNALPSGVSGAVSALLRLSILADRPDWREKADRILKTMGPAIKTYPSSFSYLACQLDFATSKPKEIALVGPEDSPVTQAFLQVVNTGFRPNQVIAAAFDNDGAHSEIALLKERKLENIKSVAYVCQNYVCQTPAETPEHLSLQLSSR